MYRDILNKNQLELLPLIKQFSGKFYLAGGTAVALHLGHRQSLDFDLFSAKPIHKKRITDKISEYFDNLHVLYQESDQIHFMVHSVKLTFLEYGFDITHKESFENIISLPSLLDLAAMKAYTLGRRAKWKDYVDMYFVFQHGITLAEVSERSSKIFGSLFSEKIFRQQLCYFTDIDYTEAVIYTQKEVSDDEVKNFLTEIALTH